MFVRTEVAVKNHANLSIFQLFLSLLLTLPGEYVLIHKQRQAQNTACGILCSQFWNKMALKLMILFIVCALWSQEHKGVLSMDSENLLTGLHNNFLILVFCLINQDHQVCILVNVQDVQESLFPSTFQNTAIPRFLRPSAQLVTSSW